MSSVEEEYAKNKGEFEKTKKKVENKKEDKQEKKQNQKHQKLLFVGKLLYPRKNFARREEEEKKRKLEEKRKEVGFIERNTNKDYNIVYRNKPSKPMTVSELFGLKTPKQEPKEEKVLPVSENRRKQNHQ